VRTTESKAGSPACTPAASSPTKPSAGATTSNGVPNADAESFRRTIDSSKAAAVVRAMRMAIASRSGTTSTRMPMKAAATANTK